MNRGGVGGVNFISMTGDKFTNTMAPQVQETNIGEVVEDMTISFVAVADGINTMIVTGLGRGASGGHRMVGAVGQKVRLAVDFPIPVGILNLIVRLTVPPCSKCP